jgi:hypothetical protein
MFSAAIEIGWNQGLHGNELRLGEVRMGLKVILYEPVVDGMVNHFMGIVADQNRVWFENNNIIDLHLVDVKPVEIVVKAAQIHENLDGIILLIEILTHKEKGVFKIGKIAHFLHFNN